MARVLAFDDDSSSVSGGDGDTPPPPPAQQPQNKAGGATSRPLKRVARFLGDDGSDDEQVNGFSAAAYGSTSNARGDLAGLGAGQKKKKTTVQDVDRMFADLDEDDDDDLGIPLAQRKNNDIPSNSIINDTITGFNGDDGDAPNDKIDAEKAKKARRKPVLMNEERILGDKGIRRLKENLKGFKIKGKGHEEDDLRRLMNVYQLWAHQMYPAGSFRDTITQVEKLCKKRAVKSILKGWRDEAQGKLPPPLSSRDDNSDAEDGGPTRHGNSDEDDEVEVQAYAGQGTTTSQAGSPERVAPKKSYFDDIPTSSPDGALERDPDMADEEYELAESLFGSAAPAAMNSQAGPSSASAIRATTSEAGFNDADLTFDLEEEEFDMDAEAEAAMREMDDMNDDFFNSGPTAASKGKGKETDKSAQSTTKAGVKTNSAISFYAEPKASERARTGKSLVQESSRQLPSSSPAPKRSDLHEEEENFDDFDFGDEEDIMREMEQADKKQKEREAAALGAERRAASAGTVAGMTTSVTEASASKTPSLTTSSSAQDVDFDLDDAFDEDFLKDIDEAEISMSQKKLTEQTANEDMIEGAASPVKASLGDEMETDQEDAAVQPKSIAKASQPLVQEEEEEEDLYS